MESTWIRVLAILLFYQKTTFGFGSKVVADGQRVEIHCQPSELGTLVVWFRVLDKSGLEFIGSFTRDGVKKSMPATMSPLFSLTKMTNHILTLNSFSGARDSGGYGCAGLKNNELSFGPMTQLTGVPQRRVEAVTRPAVTRRPNLPVTPMTCVCPEQNKESGLLPVLCSPLILGSLAGGCFLLFLMLVVVIVYCNKIRTRRCPHHYNRKPRPMAPGKQMKNNRQI